jgi:hypothetical protein
MPVAFPDSDGKDFFAGENGKNMYVIKRPLHYFSDLTDPSRVERTREHGLEDIPKSLRELSENVSDIHRNFADVHRNSVETCKKFC